MSPLTGVVIMNRHIKAQKIIYATIFLLCGCVAPSIQSQECSILSKYKDGLLDGFAAGYKELTFSQMYDPSLKLPTKEGDFVRLLKEKHLNYDVRSEGANAICRDPPTQSLIKDMSIVKIYEITDRSKLNQGVHFAAFVNNLGKVVYVENKFEYNGP